MRTSAWSDLDPSPARCPGRELDGPRGGHHAVDRLVVSFTRDLVHELAVEHYRVHRRAPLHRAERPVEVAPTPAHPQPLTVHGGGGHHDQVDVVDRDGTEQLADRLRHAEEADVLLL